MTSVTVNPRVFGKYEVIRRLAVGGMGEIFLARQVGMAGFDRLVILKSLLPQLALDEGMLTQFLDEARIVGSINHPNVVACYEVGEWEGVYFIAMEYINGVDLATLQKACDDINLRFPIHVAMTIAREAGLGLDSAHQAADANGRPLKIVHRDISPHNVMVRQDGLAKVVDFGVAVAANRQKRTEGGLLKGKLGYMAPEQIKGQPLDGRSDQFSLGVLLWELLTGRRLFTAEDPHAVFMKIVRETVPPPSSLAPDVPVELDAIVLKMTAQNPDDRFGRLAEAAATLRKLLDIRGAGEGETADLVGGLVGPQLAERIRDLTPSPVRILGIERADEPSLSKSFCKQCGTQAVRGDRFCRSCGAPMTPRPPTGTAMPGVGSGMADAVANTAGASALPSAPSPWRGGGVDGAPGAKGARGVATGSAVPRIVDEEFAEVDVDVALDDAGEAASCVGVVELDDGAGTHVPPDALLRPYCAHLEELAARCGGGVTTSGPRVTASFLGTGRAARNALAFARKAAVLAPRAHRDLRLRVAVAASKPGGEVAPRDEAERALTKARPGVILVCDGARRLAGVAHLWGNRVTLPPSGGVPAIAGWEAPLPPRLAGRASERVVVEQALGAADVGRGQQVLFLAEAGQGKTSLLDFVDAEARDRGFIVARARCGRVRGTLRYDAVRQALRSACRALAVVVGAGAGGGDVGVGDWRTVLSELGLNAGERRRLLALMEGVDNAGDDDVPLARRRILLRAAILSFFGTVAERRGCCILVDDVHRGDPSSLDVLAEVGARLHASRFALFAAGRPQQGERVLPLAKRTKLEPLDAKDTALVAAIALHGELPPHVGELIAKASNGSPLFVTLLARHLRNIKLLHVGKGAVTESFDLERYPFPPSLPILLFASHALLPPESRDVLLAAAQLGPSFAASEVTALLKAQSAAAVTGESRPGSAGSPGSPGSAGGNGTNGANDANGSWGDAVGGAGIGHAAEGTGGGTGGAAGERTGSGAAGERTGGRAGAGGNGANGANDAAVLAALQAGVAGGALIDDGEGRFSFTTSTEQQVLAARTDPAAARVWHAALARALDDVLASARSSGATGGAAGAGPGAAGSGIFARARPATNPEARAGAGAHVDGEERLIEHALSAELRDHAASASERAGDAWARIGAVDAAAENYRRALHARWKLLGGDIAATGATDAPTAPSHTANFARASSVLGLAARATLAIAEVDAHAAVDLVQPIIRALPPERALVARAEAMRARGSVLLKLRRVEDARDALVDALAALEYPTEIEVDLDATLDGTGNLPDVIESPADDDDTIAVTRSAIRVDLAAVEEQAGNPDGARQQLKEALEGLAHVDVKRRGRVAVDALVQLGKLQLRTRELAAARESLMQALDESQKHGSTSAQIDVLVVWAQLAQNEGDVDAARRSLDQALTLANAAGDGVAEARARVQLARLLHASGKVADALLAAKQSLALSQRLAWDEGIAVAGQLAAAWDAPRG